MCRSCQPSSIWNRQRAQRARTLPKLLCELLDSNHAELVSIGAWILDELHFELYNSDSFILRLRKLLDHNDPAIRFHAFGALFPALDPRDADTQALLEKLRNDPNKGVRMSAEAAAARWSLT